MAAHVVNVTIANIWLVDEYPDMFQSHFTGEYRPVNWVHHSDTFNVARFEGFVVFASKVSNDRGMYLVMKTRIPWQTYVPMHNQVMYAFDYRMFFLSPIVWTWINGFNESIV